MATIYLKYNPYTFESEIGVNGYFVQEPSRLIGFSKGPLQDWIGQLIPVLKEETPDSRYAIDFYGLDSDFEIVAESMNQYMEEHADTEITIQFLETAFEAVMQEHTQIEQLQAEQSAAQQQEDLSVRTHKGVLFASEEDKNQIVQIENDLLAYCQDMDSKTFEELWEKKEYVTQLPPQIFGTIYNSIAQGMSACESKEKLIYTERIEQAELSDTEEIKTELYQHHYSSNTKEILLRELSKRERVCQRAVLEDKTRSLELLDREMLRKTLTEIRQLGYDESLTDEFALRINRKIDLFEMKELENMCAGLADMKIPELEELEQKIKEKCFQEKFTLSYFTKIKERIKEEHEKNMEENCKPLPEAEREEVVMIKASIDQEDCSPELKGRFYAQVNARLDQLDFAELTELTSEIEEKNLDELETLMKEITSGKYSDKYVGFFAKKVRTPMEIGQKKLIDDMIVGIDTMDKNWVSSILNMINEKGYSDCVTRLAKDKIAERLSELELKELMAYRNDFDYMTLADIADMRNYLNAGNYSSKVKAAYESKLSAREQVAALSSVSQISAFAKQIIDQQGYGSLNIKVPVYSPDYMQHLTQYFQNIRMNDYNDIPVAIIPDMGHFALTRTAMYFQSTNGYIKINLSDFKTFLIEKKLIVESLAVTMTNGMNVPVNGSTIKRNLPQIANFFSFLIQNMSNTGMLAQYAPYEASVGVLDENSIEKITLPEDISRDYVLQVLARELRTLELQYGASKCMKHILSDGWNGYDGKIRAGYGVVQEAQFVMCYDKSMFNNAKEGLAMGTMFFHVKKSNQPDIAIPIKEIYEIRNSVGGISIISGTGIATQAEFALHNEQMKELVVKLLNDYVKGIQMTNQLFGEPTAATQPIPVQNAYQPEPQPAYQQTAGQAVPQPMNSASSSVNSQPVNQQPTNQPGQTPKFCRKCGNQLRGGMKFCSKCGTRME